MINLSMDQGLCGYLAEPFHVDGFAGGGGASEGYELATGLPVRVALNHDREAVAMHRMNHPATDHYCEDIRRVDPVKVCKGRQPTSAWFSPDCKDFSKAKGGKPKNKRIRGLAWTVIHWINKVRPLVIYLENVEEFEEWCPLLPDGSRNPELLGWFFECFVGAMRRRGYTVEWRELRACDYSATPTIRKRLYLVARCDGRPIVWPEKWSGEKKVAADVLDFTLPCPSIFMTRRQARSYTRQTGIKIQRPLARASLRRIAVGVERFVMRARDPFVVCLTHHGRRDGESVREPFKTVTGARRGERALVVPVLARAQHGGGARAVTQSFHTITASPKDQNQLLGVHLARQFGTAIGSDLHSPAPSVMAGGGGGKSQLVSVFLAQNNTGVVGHAATSPVSTVCGRGTNQAVVALGLVKYYGTEQGADLRGAMHTVTTKDRFGLLEAELELPVLTPALAEQARRVARLLRRFGVKVEGEFAMCGEFVIVDIGMRMLAPRELYKAQGFGADYIIERGMDIDEATGRLFEIELSKTAQVRMCGNSVCPLMACELIRANQPEYALKEIAA